MMTSIIYQDNNTMEADGVIVANAYAVEEDGSVETIATKVFATESDNSIPTESMNKDVYDVEIEWETSPNNSIDIEETEIYTDSKEVDLTILKSPEYLPVYKYGERIEPSVNIPSIGSNTDMRNYIEEVDTSEYLYIGTYSITGYTPKCYHCCGNTKGITASGVEAISGYTVAADKSIPFGTTLYIEGYGFYIVEDRGYLGRNVIDIAAPNHDSCYDLTNTGVNVYVIP